MTSDKQVATNRRNTALSTGPRSEAGKARSSQNALKHGLTAQRVVLFDENPAVFEALRNRLYAYYEPENPYAEYLVEQVAAAMWRLRRVPEIYAGILEANYYSVQAAHSAPDKYGYLRTDEEDKAREMRKEPRPVLGQVYTRAERPLNSLTRISAALKSSVH